MEQMEPLNYNVDGNDPSNHQIESLPKPIVFSSRVSSETEFLFGFGPEDGMRKWPKWGHSRRESEPLEGFVQKYPEDLFVVTPLKGRKALRCRFCPQVSFTPNDRQIREHLDTNSHMEQKHKFTNDLDLGEHSRIDSDSESLSSSSSRHSSQVSSKCSSIIMDEKVQVTPVKSNQTKPPSVLYFPSAATSEDFSAVSGALSPEGMPKMKPNFEIPPPPAEIPYGRRAAMVHMKWEFFHANMSNAMSDFRKYGKFIDLTISVERESIPCHKLVLASCSTYFEQLLTDGTMSANSHPVVMLKDMRFWEVSALVDFMYRGELSIPEHLLKDFVAAAKTLEVKGLWVQDAYYGANV